MIKFEVVEADSKENTITLDAGDYFNKGYVIELGEELFLPEAKPNFPINKYEEDLAKASEILNKANLPKLLDIALNAIDDAIMDIDMEAEQEWHAKITLESSLIEIAEHIENQPKLSIPKKIAELINTGDTEYIRWSFADDFIPGNDFVGTGDDWRDHENYEAEIVRRKALVSAYLAGKALGVELVEVEG
ncbi:hypothetical protein ACI1UB_04990 [Lactococcus petauri]|uniref:hypothetical protein n=1 Tax=Lactococcus petauri TaxID=1940789 RepID=UPI003851C91D